jgi:hypothetical protein
LRAVIQATLGKKMRPIPKIQKAKRLQWGSSGRVPA